MKKEFISVFQLSKMDMFEVNYYTLGNNKNPHFATSSMGFIRSKKDYNTCGQCQETIVKNHRIAYNFYKKWDKKHCNDLDQLEYEEMINDLQELKEKYNYIYEELEEKNKPYNPNIRYYDIVELSKKKVK